MLSAQVVLRLRLEVANRNISWGELADLIGISQAMMSAIKNGSRKPCDKTLKFLELEKKVTTTYHKVKPTKGGDSERQASTPKSVSE